ncbi:EamA-like transporter family protein [Labrenzia sp. THAF82]|uniref:DMT family transporter n=1 Tax=Labrenzia sp. THAF82 TaxID=2587861 RepID=UPI001268D977|nr:DMT family transporter [Labrenzia sp. THAF82]QFT29957.1 EamA-like transporter family protein [Labrenzia sp. THAF82]
MRQNKGQKPIAGVELPSAPLAGIGLIVLAALSFSILDAVAKYLSATLPTLQIAWIRFVSHAVLAIIAFRVWNAPSLLKTERPVLQIIRTLCLLGTTVFNFLAVRYLQLAETTAIMFAGPLLITALAGPLLGEWAGPRRWVAILVGFGGVLFVTQPGTGAMHWAAIYSVAAMISYALYALLTRQLTATENSAGMLIISGLLASILMTPSGLSVWVMPPDLWTWILLLGTGVLGAGGHMLFIKAHTLAPAPVLAPFMYSQIIWMIGLGLMFFNDVPTVTTLIGAAIVVASGLYILYRERVKSL